MGSQEIRLYTGIIIATVSFVIVMAGFLIWVVTQHRKHVTLLKQFNEAEINAMEKDRARIANDLHDHLSPQVASVKMALNHFELNRDSDVELLEKTNRTIDDLSQGLREISFDLMPSSLQRDGLLRGVEQLALYQNRTSDLKINLDLPAELSLPQEHAVHLYRIIQEIMHNTTKHAKATELKIGIFKEDEKLIVTTKDNGIGFNYFQKQKERRGLGLQSIRGRAELMKGDLDVESQPGKGSCFTITIPI